MFGFRALSPQGELLSNIRWSLILPATFVWAVLPALQNLSRRTAINISLWVIVKLVLPKKLFSQTALALRDIQIRHVGNQAPIMAGQKIFRRAVLAVGYHSPYTALGVALMLLHQRHQLRIFVHRTACGDLRRDHSLGHHPPLDVLIAGLAGLTFLGSQLRLRIGGTDMGLVNEIGRGCRLIQFGCLVLVIL